ncbi:MAG: hypothetical protein IMZ54_04305 [Acidobacteria bacterium]|nr:hypothetical protein [Acidobacteriota bacterium]
MTPSACPARTFLQGAILYLAALPFLWGQAPERTLFKDFPPDDPCREIIQTVLDSPLYSMRGGFTAREWTGGGYGGAWERARQYFPNQVYFVRPGTFFMTHGFSPDGRLFMEVHESAYLSLCVENRKTFTDGSIVGEYGRMAGATDGREAASFQEKMGKLERYFHDEAAKASLRRALGDGLYLRLLRELREEDYHMFAGGLMHEGMHAGMDNDLLVAGIQAEFRAGRLPVQWDELRAYMAEVGYHRPYCRWAAGDIAAGWRQVEDLLKELEALRKKPKLFREADKARFERAKAKIGAHLAFIRLRMREIWQSTQRMQGLTTSVRKDYVRPDPPADVDGLITKLASDTAGFVDDVGEAIQRTELTLRALEETLELWDEWAAGRRPFPPPVTDSNDVLKRVGDTPWPTPPGDEVGALMKRAGEEIAKVRASLPSGRSWP